MLKEQLTIGNIGTWAENFMHSKSVSFLIHPKESTQKVTQPSQAPTQSETQHAPEEIRVQASARVEVGKKSSIEVTMINPTSEQHFKISEGGIIFSDSYSAKFAQGQKKVAVFNFKGLKVGTVTVTFTCGNAAPKTVTITVYEPTKTQIDLDSSASVSLGGRQNVGVTIRDPSGPATVNVNNNNVTIEGGLVETERLSNQIKYNMALKGNAVGTTNITIICGGTSKMIAVNCYQSNTEEPGENPQGPTNPGNGAGNNTGSPAAAVVTGNTGTPAGAVVTTNPTTTTTPVYVAPTPPPDTTAPVIESITANVDMSKEFHNEYKITYLLVFNEPIKNLDKSHLTVKDTTNNKDMEILKIYRSGSSYKKWKVQVISKKAKYEQKFTLKKNTVEDNAGNKNTKGKSLTLKIDRCKPAIIVNSVMTLGNVVQHDTSVTSGATVTNTTSTSSTKTISSSDTISVSFSIREANPIEYVKNSKKTTYINRLCDRCLKYENSSSEQKTKVSNKIKEYITVTVGGKKDDNLQLWLKRDGNREENGKKMEDYTLTIKNVTRSGKIKVQLNKGISKDLAGNETTAKNLIDGTLTADNKKPTIKTISISSNNGNPKYAKNGDTITIRMEGSTNFEDLAVKPKAYIYNQKEYEMTVTGKGKNWVATYKIPNNENKMKEGVLTFAIGKYAKANGLEGTVRRKTTDGTSIIYDRTAPQLDGKIYYNTKKKDNTNKIWQQTQKCKITASDNNTKASKITEQYVWAKTLDADIKNWTKVNNGKVIKINKDTSKYEGYEGTGKYYLFVMFKDEAGNELIRTTEEMYLDVSVTKTGYVTATKETKNGEKYTSGTFVSDNIYLTLNDGKDEESGLKDNYYIVSKEKSDGTYVDSGKNIGDTILSKPGHYKVTTYTHDNLGNEGTRELEIFKETGNVQITNLTEYQDTKKKITNRAHFNVKITDKANTYSKVEYAWREKGADESQLEYTNVEEWQITKMKSDDGIDAYGPKDKKGNYIHCNGTYILCIRTTDSKGNVNVVKSEEVNVYNTISDENMPTLDMKTVNPRTLEEIGEYENNSWTNSSVIIKINNENKKDDYGTPITDVSYEIKKDEATYIGAGATGETVLTDEGRYTIILSAKNGLGGTGVKSYSVKIDKTIPTAEFSGTAAYGTTSKIKITLSDNSGLQKKGNRYYWSRSMQAPKVSDFYGNLEGDVRGDIGAKEQEIQAPSDVSGMWYLWVYAIDLAGNTAIIGSHNSEGNIPANVDNEKPIPGEISMKVNDENGKVYTPNDGWTKENIYLSLIPGYDADSGVRSNTYSINKDGKSYKVNLTEPTTLEEEGEYEIIVTTVDNQNNQETRSYTLKIDKSAPTIVINPINGNENWATKQSAEVKITDEKSGVNDSKTKIMWIGCENDEYNSFEEIKEIVNPIVGQDPLKEHLEEINERGILIYDATLENGEVKTPDGLNGKYYLYVRTYDNLNNKNTLVSEKPFLVNNTNPTTPYSVATIKENIGTQEKEITYYGETTNKKVNAYAMYSDCLSGVSGYEVKYKKLEDPDWSAWENATTKKNIHDEETLCGYKEFTEEGIYVVKFRAVSELYKELPTSKTKDAKLYSEETEEIVIKINLTGPEVSFANYDGGTNGSEEAIRETKVKATATDENEGNLETLKYAWVKFNSLSEFNTFKNSEHTIEELKAKMTNTTTFANGEEIPSPEGAEGIYSLFVYSEDSLGNASVHYSNYYIFNITGPEVKFVNSENTKYGNEEEISSGKVKVTVTDENKVNNETLRYSWIKFNSVEEYETFKNGKYTLNELKAKMINTTRFTNGEEISTPTGAEGIYSLFVYSEDILGNASIYYSNYYKLFVNVNITEKIDENFAYKYKENTIYRVKPETTVAKFIENIDKTFKLTNYQVFDKQGKEIKAEDYSTTLITTNCKVKIKDLTADISVIGDLNADGHFNSVDLTRMRFNLIGKIELTKVEKFAADLNDDGSNSVVDLTRMRFILIGVSEI